VAADLKFLVNRIKESIKFQHDAMDCGPACVATIINFFGGTVHLETIKENNHSSKQGTTFLELRDILSKIGLCAEGYIGDINELKAINMPSILHIVYENNHNHFVVCFGFKAGHFHIADPTVGYLPLSEKKLNELWVSKKLLLVEPTSSFQKKNTYRKEKIDWLIKLLNSNKQNLFLILGIGLVATLFNIGTAIFTQKLIDEIIQSIP
jgi:ABC-type bacteriocin/lantibiotic exporter with double-glycine peptidase domain